VVRITAEDAAGQTTTQSYYFVRAGLREAIETWRAAVPSGSDNGNADAKLDAARANLTAAIASFDAGEYGNIGLLAQQCESNLLAAKAFDGSLDVTDTNAKGLQLGRVFTGFLEARLASHRQEVDDNDTFGTAEEFIGEADDSDDVGTILNSLANAYFWMEDGRDPMVATSFADTQPLLGRIIAEIGEYIANDPALVGEDELGDARTNLAAVKVLVDRVVADGDRSLSDREHVELLLGLTNTAENLKSSQALGAWVRNWQWGITQIVYIYAARGLRNAADFVGPFHPVYLEGVGELDTADGYRGERRADDFMTLLIDSRCLTIAIYNKGYDPDVDPPQACCEDMLRYAGLDQSFPVPPRCSPPFCGNGIQEDGEACDDGNNVDGDGCDSQCRDGAYCGDGTRDDNEECDDGNNEGGDGCDAECNIDPFCGDGDLDDGEICDDGNSNNRDGCNSLCRSERLDVDYGGTFTNGFPAGESSTFFFSTEHNPTRVVLRTSNGDGGCPGDTTVTLYRVVDGNRTQVNYNDDGGDGLCSLIDGTVTTPGDYEVKVSDFGNNDAIENFTFQAQVWVQANTTGSYNGAFGEGGHDLFRTTLDSASDVVFETGNGEGDCPAGNTTMSLYPLNNGVRGNRIEFDDDDGPGLCSRVARELEAGAYEVEIGAADDGNHSGYVLSATIEVQGPRCGDDNVDDGEQCDDGDQTNGDGCNALCRSERTDVNNGGTFTSGFPAGQNSVFFFSVEHNTTHVRLQTTNGGNGCPGDTTIRIYRVVDGNRTQTHYDDDDGQGLCSLLEEDLAPGDYEAVVQDLGDNNAIEDFTFLADIHVPVAGNGEFNGGFAAGGFDLFRFTLQASTEVTLSTGDGEGGCPTGDTVLELYPFANGAPGNLIESDDDDGVGLCSRVVRTLDAGTYQVKVRAIGNNAHSGYVLTADFASEEPGCGDDNVDDGEQCDDGNTNDGDGCSSVCRNERVNVDNGGSFEGGFPAGQTQRFVFSVEHNPTHATLRTSDGNGGCPADTTMRLYRVQDGNRTQVGYDDDGGDGRCSLLNLDLAPGDYEADLQEYGNNEAIESFTFESDIFVNVAGTGSYNGKFSAGGHDLFRFTLEQTGNVTFATGDGQNGCPAGDTTLSLFPFANGVPGNRIVFDDDGGVNLCSRISRQLNAGTYQIEVRELGNRAHAGYILTATIQGGAPRCGDGNTDEGEQCDDGGLAEGDGCNSVCQTERLNVDDGGTFTSGFAQGQSSILVFSTENNPTHVTARTSNGNNGCPGDTTMRLYRVVEGQRTFVEFDDDDGPGLCSLIDRDVTTPGNYELEIQDYGSNDAIPQFTLELDVFVEVSNGGEFDGAFQEAGHDLYRFTLEEATSVTLFTGDGDGGCPEDNGDTTMGLFPFANGVPGNRIEYNDDEEENDTLCSHIERQLAAGTYQVEIRGYDDDPHEGYVLTVSIEGGEAVCGDGNVENDEQCDDGNTVNGDGCNALCYMERAEVNNGGTVTSGFPAGQNTVFLFTVENNPTHIFLQTNNGAGGCPGDTTMRLHRVVEGQRTEVQYNDDGGPGFCSEIERDLTPGDYEVQIEDYRNDDAIEEFNFDADI
jgi:cysteine-rich repeat protein